MNSLRNLFIGLGVLALIVAAFVSLRHATRDVARERLEQTLQKAKEKAKEKGEDELLKKFGNAVASGAQLSGTDEQGRPLWSVGADKSRLRTDENGTTRATLQNARATLYREGKPQSQFRSAAMELTRTADDKVHLVLSGGVNASTNVPPAKSAKLGAKLGASGPVTLTTPRVEIDVTARRLVAAAGVTMTQGQGAKAVRVTASRLDADALLSTTRVTGGMTATAPQGTLRAAQATWNWQSGRVTASGGVTAQHDDTVLSGARLDADVQGKSGVLSGGVTAKSPHGTARASSVSYNWAAGRVVVAGGVTLAQGDASLRAARIECDDKLQSAVATGGVTLTKDGVRLVASRAEATQGLARASASGGVTITKDDVTVRAARVDSFDDFARAVASGAVTLTKGAATLRAGHVEVLDKGARAVATGGVTLRQNDLTMKAARAEAKNLGDKRGLSLVAMGGVTARNAAGTVQAARVTWAGGKVAATGGVRAQRADFNLTADRFEVDDAGQRAVLSGNVVVKHPSGASLRAPKARYDKAANKVWAEGGVEFHDAGGGVLRGKTLVANLQLKRAQMSGVEGNVSVKTFEDKDLF